NDLNNQIFLEQVKLTYTDVDVNWIITSDRGQIISDMNILSLSGNVLIRNNTENNNSKISTDYIEINPNTFTVATNRKVIIEINNNIIEAKGLSAQLKDNKLKFSSNINVNIQN
ncbi:MAG: LPS export ABC transporter periplasmic protein LptC, partial [Gammaproteobacteria bacterium]|nr:LPS export ABC transporter periplasmic protein LptC [Gammaproteobacteria bacterium]